MWESVRNMRSTSCSSMDWGNSSPTPWSPPSHQMMAQTHFPMAGLLACMDEIRDAFCLLEKSDRSNWLDLRHHNNMIVHAGGGKHHWLCSSGSMTPSPAPIGASTPSFSASHPLNIKEWGDKSALADCRALLDNAQWAYLRYRDGWRWDNIDGPSLDAIVHAIQLWYCHHSIRKYLAWQTQRRLAVTTIQCWKRCIWLDCWFAQQAKKRLHQRSLCRGALAYTMLVRGSQRPPPTPTNTPTPNHTPSQLGCSFIGEEPEEGVKA